MVAGFDIDQVFGNSLLDYFLALGIVLASIILGKIVYYTINKHVKKIIKKTDNRLDDILVDAIEGPIILLIFAVGLYVAQKMLVIPPSMQIFISGAVTAVFVIDIVWLKTRIIDIVVREYLRPLTKKTRTNLDEQILPLLQKGLTTITVIVGGLIIISNFGVNINALLAGMGVGGLAIALASKDTVENLFGAFTILLDRPFRIHDRVIIDGVTGEVTEVGLRSTRLRTINNTEFIIPNGMVASSKIENISRPDKQLARTLTLSVTYDTTLEKLREGIDIVKDVLAKADGVSNKYQPLVVFKEFSDSSLNIFVKLWVKDFKQRHQVMDSINQSIKEGFERAKIEFAYPTQTIHLKKETTV